MLLNCGVGEDSWRLPWAALRSNQSILKEISPEYSFEGVMLKLKLQYFGHPMQRTTHWKRPWCWERLKTGEGDNRGWDGWMASPTQWAWTWVSSGSWWWTGRPGVLWSMGLQSWIWLSNWTEQAWFLRGVGRSPLSKDEMAHLFWPKTNYNWFSWFFLLLYHDEKIAELKQ